MIEIAKAVADCSATAFCCLSADQYHDFNFERGIAVLSSINRSRSIFAKAIESALLDSRFVLAFFKRQADRKLLFPSKANTLWAAVRLNLFFSRGSLDTTHVAALTFHSASLPSDLIRSSTTKPLTGET